MKLIITEDVLAYAASKGETVLTLDLFTAGNCCVPLSEPHVHFGPPKDPVHKYDLIEQDGLTIYVFKGADAKRDTLTLKLKRFFGVKSIEVEGLKVL
jgi:hypothetical protein